MAIFDSIPEQLGHNPSRVRHYIQDIEDRHNLFALGNNRDDITTDPAMLFGAPGEVAASVDHQDLLPGQSYWYGTNKPVEIAQDLVRFTEYYTQALEAISTIFGPYTIVWGFSVTPAQMPDEDQIISQSYTLLEPEKELVSMQQAAANALPIIEKLELAGLTFKHEPTNYAKLVPMNDGNLFAFEPYNEDKTDTELELLPFWQISLDDNETNESFPTSVDDRVLLIYGNHGFHRCIELCMDGIDEAVSFLANVNNRYKAHSIYARLEKPHAVLFNDVEDFHKAI